MSKRANKKKNQHYVFQNYLRKFSNEQGQCYVCDKKDDKNFSANPRNICSENYLYNIDPTKCHYKHSKYQDQFSEDYIMNIEGLYDLIVRNLESNPEWFNKEKNLNKLYKFISVQYVRTPSKKKILGMAMNELFPVSNINDENFMFAFELENILTEHPANCTLGLFLKRLGKELCVGINNTDIPFITSDNPINWLQCEKEEFIFYPVTPKYCFLWFNPEYTNIQDTFFSGGKKNEIGQMIFEELDVLSFNYKTYEGARRYVISSDKPLFITYNQYYNMLTNTPYPID